MDAELAELSAALGLACQAKGVVIATAESCTGGWVAQLITHTAGSSAWFDRGFVTYSNDAKTDMLDVPVELIARHGAVSLEVAAEMARGALKNSKATVALAITGIAGPTASPGKPVGTVCFAWIATDQQATSETRHFTGSREDVRRQAVKHSLHGLLAKLANLPG